MPWRWATRILARGFGSVRATGRRHAPGLRTTSGVKRLADRGWGSIRPAAEAHPAKYEWRLSARVTSNSPVPVRAVEGRAMRPPRVRLRTIMTTVAFLALALAVTVQS